MNQQSTGEAFTPRPRRTPGGSHAHDKSNLVAELDALIRRIDRVRVVAPEDFSDGAPEYDTACMVIIRIAALLEREEHADAFQVLTDEEKRAIRTTRNMAAHAGYPSMNDELLYLAVTRRIPAMIDRVKAEPSP